ncbi:MAG: hypothetical protein A3K65_08120 [Euryarchaeota archaeon RBG_16_68_12]|nr:MAG: hypothetical protein A3K65_08120 [Euryarchaeota archaeon RBG_16_68_12]
MYATRPRKDLVILGALLGVLAPANYLAVAVLGMVPGAILVFWTLLFWGAAVLFVVGSSLERGRGRTA